MGRKKIRCGFLLAGLVTLAGCYTTGGQEAAPLPPAAAIQILPGPAALAVPPVLPALPASRPEDKPLPINLPTALKLANVQAVDIAAAAARIEVAAAVLEQARVLWLPTLTLGGDYDRHDGRNQDTSGAVFDNSRSYMMFGVGTGIGQAAILNVNDAIFAPLVARQQLRSRQADRQTASNDTLVAVSDAYFTVQQARGELAGAVAATRRTEDLVRRTRKLAPGIVPDLETYRAETELGRRRQVELLARERWKVASADLARILRLDPAAQIEPLEPPQLRVGLIALDRPVDELIPIALTTRPELTSQQAQVQATLTLLKQERLRPLIPSVLLRGGSTSPVAGTLAGGVFAGGPNGSTNNAGWRGDLDLQLLWQLDNLGFGNVARVHQRQAENRLAMIDLFRIQDRVAAEVAQAYNQAQLAGRRVDVAAQALEVAVISADKNLIALSQPKTVGNMVVLLVRPQEAVAAVQALAQAYADYYTAVADSNRAQFRLYRALGRPAQALAQDGPPPGPGTLPTAPCGPPAVEVMPPLLPRPAVADQVDSGAPPR